jgi:hypothetical protein
MIYFLLVIPPSTTPLGSPPKKRQLRSTTAKQKRKRKTVNTSAFASTVGNTVDDLAEAGENQFGFAHMDGVE